MASCSSATPLLTPAFDVEQGNDRRSGPEGEISIAFRYYYCVYAFSLFIVTVSIWMFLFPFSNGHLVGNVVGSGGLVIGAFLILNTDLLVTYVRLLQETRRFRENNESYKASLVQQKAHVRDLKGIEKALRTFDANCHGNMAEFQDELTELNANAQDRVRQNVEGVLAITRLKQQDIQAGKDLQTVLQVFSNSYVHAFPMIDRRYEEMMKGLEASPRWQQVQSLSVNRLKTILADVFFEDIEDIKDSVRQKADAELDAVASGFFEEGEDSSWAVQYDETLPEKENASVVAKEDSWAEAAAFAGVQQGHRAPEVPKKDSWAEAMEFAGVDR